MKKLPLKIILATVMTSGMALSASAGQAPGVHTTHESGVKVYRGAPLHVNHQAAAAHKALELRERQIKNQNRLAQARLNAETKSNQDRLNLDRRIAFTDNEIFSNQGNRNGRRFVSRGINNRFFGINGISRNSRSSKSFK